MVRTDTSSSSASCRAVSRPRVCNISRIDSSRDARTPLTIAVRGTAVASPDMGDFDFLNGSWTIANRRLTKLLAGSDDWDEFPATSSCVPFFGGAANAEEYVCAAKGFRGLSVRSFDPAREEWSIWWINSRD